MVVIVNVLTKISVGIHITGEVCRPFEDEIRTIIAGQGPLRNAVQE